MRTRTTKDAALRPLGLSSKRIGFADLLSESSVGPARRPGRALLTALGTLLGVSALVTITGLTQTAQAQVSSSFNAELATQVTFQQVALNGAPVLTESSEASVEALDGVIHAGLISPVNGNQPLPVTRTPNAPADEVLDLPVTVATPGALETMHAQIRAGRGYDAGFERRHEMVALIGQSVAQQLGITQVDGNQAIFVNAVPLTVLGIVSSAVQDSQALLGVIVPPEVAQDLSTSMGPPSIIVQTAQGAAQVVGQEGPTALSPDDPGGIVAQVPPSPQTLRAQVEGSFSSLLFILALVALLIGIVAIANTTLLSVIQRTSEIGLRRALGATPRHIGALILVEAAIVGGLGGLLGTSLGVLVTALASVLKGWTPVLEWQVAVAAPFVGVLAGALAGIYPARRASSIAPVAALQSS